MCLAAAPILGDIVTVVKPLVSYRVHGRNDGAMLDLKVDHFAREVTRAQQRFDYGQRVAKTAGIPFSNDALDKGLSYLQYRFASLKLTPDKHPIAGDSIPSVLTDAVKAVFYEQGYGNKTKLVIVVWIFALATLPRAMARILIQWRFAPATRPKIIQHLLAATKLAR